MKRISRFLVCAALACTALCLSALGVFTPVREAVAFPDVAAGHWSQPYISRCYELGLMSGTGETTFSPSGNVSVAQGIMVAVRLQDLYQGGDGVIDQSGDTWYDNAVSIALSEKLIAAGQFDSYTRPATRAELAGLLANALPKKEYKAINSVDTLPDVDETTPYAEDIFRLYNAGILSGSDAYGTFNPGASITRAEISAIICRLVEPSTRLTLSLQDPPLDLTVYSTDKLFYLNGIPSPGVVRIDGEYYFPLELFDRPSNLDRLADCYYAGPEEDADYYGITFLRPYDEVYYTAISYPTPNGKVLGTANAAHGLSVNYHTTPVEDAVYTISGYYPMVSLKALGAKARGSDFYLDTGAKVTPVEEGDLIGQVLPSLQRSTDRETLLAIHDYVVNTLTYDPLTDSPSGFTQAQYDAAYAVWEQAWAKYNVYTNVTLEAKYGVCQDYAELFEMMCIRSGIACALVSGGNHAWNRVYIDGQWLFVDTTWDDPVGRGPVLRHDYFLVDANAMVTGHYWEDEDYPMPEKYDPAWEQLDPNNITSADMFRKCLVAQAAMAPGGTSTITLRTTRSGSYGGFYCLYAYPESWFWSVYGGHSGGGVYTYTIVR